MNLYELTANQQRLLDLAESGNVEEEVLKATFDSLDEAIEDKAESYAYVDKELAFSEEKLQAEIKRLQERKKSITNNRKKLKNSLKDAMLQMDKRNIKTDKFTIFVKNNPKSLNVEDERNVPKQFFIEQQPKLDKKALMNELERTGEELDGVEITQSESVVFR